MNHSFDSMAMARDFLGGKSSRVEDISGFQQCTNEIGLLISYNMIWC